MLISIKKLLIIFLILFSYTSVNAEITSNEKRFSLLCEAEQSVGFRWENEDWKKMNWTLQRYIITKQDYEPLFDSTEAEHFFCSTKKEGYYHNKNTSKIYMDSCYFVKNFTAEESPLNYKTCREEWDADTNVLNKVTCKGDRGESSILFKPNAWFTHYYIARQVANVPKEEKIGEYLLYPEGHKDEMHIYVGRCSTL
jgi:hypothetical protein